MVCWSESIVHPESATPLLLGIGGVGIGIFVPSYYLGRRARIRQRNIAKQLSDVLDLLVVCVEAGMGLFEAIRIVGAECERHGQEIGTELNLVATDISAGASLGQALRGLADRTAVDDIKPLAATLIQSEQLGAQIGPALRSSSDALRTRRRLHAEEDAQKASIKILFPLVIFVLPSMIAVIIGPAMISVLHTLSIRADPRPQSNPNSLSQGASDERGAAPVRGLFVLARRVSVDSIPPPPPVASASAGLMRQFPIMALWRQSRSGSSHTWHVAIPIPTKRAGRSARQKN